MPTSPYKKLLLFIGAISLFRLFVSANFELSIDEGYYWQWSDYLSLSYYDHPPMVALMIAFTTIFSDAEIFIRLGAVAGVAVTSILLYRLAEELYGDGEAGLNAAILANITLILSVGALVATPDAPLIPFYTAALLLFFRSVKPGPGAGSSYLLWVATGVAIGCAMLSKYTAVFFFPCGVLYFAMSKKNRGWLLKPHPYVTALTAFAVFSPVLVWNSQNGWISFAKQAGHGLSASGDNAIALFAEFIGLQIILYSIGIFFCLAVAQYALLKGVFSKNRNSKTWESALFLFSFSAPILLFFVINSFRTQVEGNWPVLGFIPLFVQAGFMIPKWESGPRSRMAFRFSVGLAALLFLFLHIQLVNPVIPHPQRYEISRRVFGWELLGTRIDEARKKVPATFLISNRHQVGALMTYYTTPHLTSYLLGSNNRRLNFLQPVDNNIGKDALYLTQIDRDHIENISVLFDRTEKVDTIEIVRKGELIRRFVLYRCYNYHGGLEKI